MKFSEIKSETLNLRVSPSFKWALKKVASSEQRSMVNMLEVLLSEYCDRKGIAIDESNTTVARSWGEEKHRSYVRGVK